MLRRSFYSDSIAGFLSTPDTSILGALTEASTFAVETTQRDAWLEQIDVLRPVLSPYAGRGHVYFELTIPRLGKRIDVVAVIDHAVFVIEFKVGDSDFTASAVEQVWDYALDLKNFHETTHRVPVIPILVATRAPEGRTVNPGAAHADQVFAPARTAPGDLGAAIAAALAAAHGEAIDALAWGQGRYSPTPTIIEAARALYANHSVADISRSDAGARNLRETSRAIADIIRDSRNASHKSICFVTGVPGAGKTLVGLDIATQHSDAKSALHSVFLSGNGPLVAILREALARDKVERERVAKRRFRLGQARSEVKAFIQNVHHFRDECLADQSRPPVEHVALFDEAQRAWNAEQTAKFMLRKKGRANFADSEPEFLISCMNRHPDWAVVVCLVGGGQEINTGEAGIGEWIESLGRSFPGWHVHISPKLHDSEYGAGAVLQALQARPNVSWNEHLHLGVSMRSFRAENVSAFVKQLLDCAEEQAADLLSEIAPRYPIALTRCLQRAKAWLKSHARGSERYGMVVSSQALRLKPHAIDVRAPTDPVHWFLDTRDDTRSSYYLEDAATEFDVQGLELDWTCVVWDGDFRKRTDGWSHHSFVGNRWNRIAKPERQTYLKNAYRVLLTRARQGMVIVVPEAEAEDPTRSSECYDQTFAYLRRLGLAVI